MTATTAPAIAFDMPDAEYRAAPGLSSTGLKHLLESPARFDWERRHRTDKKAFDLGHAVHAKVLGAGLDVAVIPAEKLASNGAASTKDAKEFIAGARAEGLVPIKPDEWAAVERMANAVLANDDARALLEAPGNSEASAFWDDPETGIECKGRFDRLLADVPIAVDVKTTGQTADPRHLPRYAVNLGWDVQASHYRAAAEILRGTPHRFLHVVVETTDPHLVSVVELDADFLAIGEARRRTAVDLFVACTAAAQWPGYPAGVTPLRPPAWYAAADIDPEEYLS
ncbi:PD-(D/E)XK nuclease-like domain-containing protein [Isoptericola sp. NPDC055881]